jgi:hypothetical protein
MRSGGGIDTSAQHRFQSRLLLLLLACGIAGGGAAADEFDRPPISYATATPDNPVERLQARLDAGAVTLEHDERYGYLPGVLRALGVPRSSQTLVFSKTSLQQAKIGPRNPRALYFNDDVYVGYVRSGDVVELSVADPALGAVFYTLDQQAVDRPRFMRQTEDCLICHGGSQTRGVPGHIMRSVYPDPRGQPIFSAGSSKVDHTTPFAHRFGGWYVTGSHGATTHLGNITYRTRPAGNDPEDTSGLNLAAIGDRFDDRGYLAAHSDLVALMVLAHQGNAHNVITRASFDTRTALHREAALNRELGEPEGHRWPSTNTVLDAAATALVECFLFCDEPRLEAPLAGTSGFTNEFAVAGPRDPQGRSVRDFDLQTRLFRHPCSFLIYSASFDALPEELRARFWTRLDAALADAGPTSRFAHLTAGDRTAIRAILTATKPGAPETWRTPR